MFGYIMFNKQEMKGKDYEMYRTWYCGLCRELREKYGIPGQVSLSYDSTFIILLLSALYEPKQLRGKTLCIVRPLKSHPIQKNVFTEYAADMNIVLMYYKCLDDWKDDRSLLSLSYAKVLERGVKSLPSAYDQKVASIKASLEELSDLEKQDSRDLDAVSGSFGRLLGEILAVRKDEWEHSLRQIGFYLGKYIYLLDAYEDVPEDIAKGNYNPLKDIYLEKEQAAFEAYMRKLLTMMLASACQEFEKLPILRYGDILRNILYSGVWIRFEMVSKKRREDRHA